MNTPPPSASRTTVAQITTTLLSHIILLCSAAVIFSFFMPWITFFGARLSGSDIQHNFESYRLLWLMPAVAAVVLTLDLAGQDINVIRRIAGLFPFIILAIAMHRLDVSFFKTMHVGAWVALAAGALLICLPNKPATTR